MEFLEIVIMTGVLIFAMMVIQNKKPREQREKQQTELEDNAEIISSNDVSNSTPNIQPGIETVYEEGGSCFDKAKPTTAASKKTNAPKSHSNRPKMEQNRADESEFDLKKAVVYSEILRPKFKDDEI